LRESRLEELGRRFVERLAHDSERTARRATSPAAAGAGPGGGCLIVRLPRYESNKRKRLPMGEQNRRGFLRLALASVTCGTASCGQTSLPPPPGGGGAGGGPGTAPTSGDPGVGAPTADVSAGRTSDLAVGSIVAVGSAPIFIGRATRTESMR
jgi:hypothetical protein